MFRRRHHIGIRLLKGLGALVAIVILFGAVGAIVRDGLIDDYRPVAEVPAIMAFSLTGFVGLLVGVPTMIRIWRSG